jgi:serine/threonine protein kinase
MEMMGYLRDALEGVNFLHRHGWLHGDLKPANISIHNCRAVLLDLDGAVELKLGEKLYTTPGSGGTLGYLAPEHEMEYFNHLAYVWSMAVLGLELLDGCHPWMFKLNPWRDEYAEYRFEFYKKYEAIIRRLDKFCCECISLHLNLSSEKIQDVVAYDANLRRWRYLHYDVEASMGQEKPLRESQRRACARPPMLGKSKKGN